MTTPRELKRPTITPGTPQASPKRSLTRPVITTAPTQAADEDALGFDHDFDAQAMIAEQDAAIKEDNKILGITGGPENTQFMFESDDWETDLKKSIKIGQDAQEREHVQTARKKGYRSPEELAAAREAAAKEAARAGAKFGAWRLLSVLLTITTAAVIGGTYVLSGGVA